MGNETRRKNDIVLLAPTPSAMRIYILYFFRSVILMRQSNFNQDKSKFLVIPTTKRRYMYNAMCNCSFFVKNKMIDNIDRFSHLAHIITSSLLDGDDIVLRHNNFVGQINNVLCFFLINEIIWLS